MNIADLRKRTGIPDLLTFELIQAYIYKQTGTLVTPQRIGRWIRRGELLTLTLPGRPRRRVTRKRFVDDLIRRNS